MKLRDVAAGMALRSEAREAYATRMAAERENPWVRYRILDLLDRVDASAEDKDTLYRIWQAACR